MIYQKKSRKTLKRQCTVFDTINMVCCCRIKNVSSMGFFVQFFVQFAHDAGQWVMSKNFDLAAEYLQQDPDKLAR